MAGARRKALILGSSRGVRRLDFTKSYPSALEVVAADKRAIDWVLEALKAAGCGPIAFVGGYHIQKMVEQYPDLHYFFQANWQREGDSAALQLASRWLDAEALICRADLVLGQQALPRLVAAHGELVVGTYSEGGRTLTAALHVEAAGLADLLAATRELGTGASLEDCLDWLRTHGQVAGIVDLTGLVAPVQERQAVARVLLGGKAQTLDRLRGVVQRSVILEQYQFTVAQWHKEPAAVLADVLAKFGLQTVVVRSSSMAEDQWRNSQAGRFVSVLDVASGDREQLRDAIETVAASLGQLGTDEREDVIFVQPQVTEIRASGVLFTRDMESRAPYYVINIERQSQRSDVVTSGRAGEVEKVVVHRGTPLDTLDADARRLVAAAQELEELTFHDLLDIEFAFDRRDNLIVFQVRPITTPAGGARLQLTDEDVSEELAQVRGFLRERMRPHPLLAGPSTLLSNMSDWNPAEMIGAVPRPLALSLYQRLIGDDAWAAARAEIGYQDVRPEPLVVALGGRAYVDVRASLNSFLPSQLAGPLREELVTAQLRRLRERPELHDKLEFEIATTCLTFDFEHMTSWLLDSGVARPTLETLRLALLGLTDAALTGRCAPVVAQRERIRTLALRRAALLASDGPHDLPGQIRMVHYLLEDCRRFGTIPFSILARYAFMSIALLRSLQRLDVLSQADYQQLMESIPTVASELSHDLVEHAAGHLPAEAFIARYGHLRPSSYDIASPNYASMPDIILTTGAVAVLHRKTSSEPDIEAARTLLHSKREPLQAALHSTGFKASVEQFETFILETIPAREWAKFEFMKNVDAVLESIATITAPLGLTRDDASFLSVEQIMRWATDSASGALRTELLRDIEFNKKRWNLTRSMQMPPVLLAETDLLAFSIKEATPNFVTQRKVVAQVCEVASRVSPEQLQGRIVLIEGADPGYDWIFGQDIAGLITQYGGAASHMTIRAAEFGLPAAIGCGELIFQRLRHAHVVNLDCSTQTIRVVR